VIFTIILIGVGWLLALAALLKINRELGRRA
jgi:hypothetical protein